MERTMEDQLADAVFTSDFTMKLATSLHEENEKLRAQIAELLPWAEEALDSYKGYRYEDVSALLKRVRSGEFGEVAQ